VADFVDKHVDKAADAIRQQLASSPWIPDSIRPRLPQPAPRARAAAVAPLSAYEKVQGWIWRHKVLTGVIVLVGGALVYRGYRRSRLGRKSRKAKRSRSGGRAEVVVIAGSPALPLTRSLSLDMERKGFIVYIVCGSIEDEVMVQSLSRPDIKPLSIDITDVCVFYTENIYQATMTDRGNQKQPPSAGASIDRFAHYLQAPHAAVPGAKRSYLTLSAVMLIPSLSYQTSPIATIPPSSFADVFNTHLLHPILTIQAFLPLLTARETSPPAKVLVFTPSIVSAIRPPFHAPEATVCSALSAFTEVLAAELRPLSIPVTHMQLGTFDFSSFTPGAAAGGGGSSAGSDKNNNGKAVPAATLTWPAAVRRAYGRNYVAQNSSVLLGGAGGLGGSGGLRGSALRDLHAAVFDVLDGSVSGAVVRVGLGAHLYGFVGRWVPRGLVAWMMGIRPVDELGAYDQHYHPRQQLMLRHGYQRDETPPYGGSDNSSRDGRDGRDGREYVAVSEGLGDSAVWKERDFYQS